MPRRSTRKRVINALQNELQEREARKAFKLLLEDLEEESDLSSPDDISISSDDTMEDLMDIAVAETLSSVSQKRFFLPRNVYRKSLGKDIFERDLREERNPDGTPPWLSDEEFLEKYRHHRESFQKLVEMIRHHPVFQQKGKRKQAPVEHQLLSFLHYLGTSGSGASNPRMRAMFGSGRGTYDIYKSRCIKAIRSLREQVIFWPDQEERMEIAKRIFLAYDFVNCIGVADGTLSPLTYEPQSEDAPDYHGRKFAYSLSIMIVNDDKKKIRHYFAGFPGSTHDNRVYNHTVLAQHPAEHFGNHFYIVGDSAFENSPTMVAAFKCPKGHALPPDEEQFNTILSKLRATSDNTIGILKARFPFLRSIPMVITDHKNSVRRILRVIDCCVILHNLLIDCGDEIPEEWLEDEDDASEVGFAIGEYQMAAPILHDHENDERRRRCMEYFKDVGLIN
jgi:hypothetical protein